MPACLEVIEPPKLFAIKLSLHCFRYVETPLNPIATKKACAAHPSVRSTTPPPPPPQLPWMRLPYGQVVVCSAFTCTTTGACYPIETTAASAKGGVFLYAQPPGGLCVCRVTHVMRNFESSTYGQLDCVMMNDTQQLYASPPAPLIYST